MVGWLGWATAQFLSVCMRYEAESELTRQLHVLVSMLTSVGDRLNLTLNWLVHVRIKCDIMDCWNQTWHRENQRMCDLTSECIYYDLASSVSDAFAIK